MLGVNDGLGFGLYFEFGVRLIWLLALTSITVWGLIWVLGLIWIVICSPKFGIGLGFA